MTKQDIADLLVDYEILEGKSYTEYFINLIQKYKMTDEEAEHFAQRLSEVHDDGYSEGYNYTYDDDDDYDYDRWERDVWADYDYDMEDEDEDEEEETDK